MYAFAKNPVKKHRQIVTTPSSKIPIQFVNLFCASKNDKPPFKFELNKNDFIVKGAINVPEQTKARSLIVSGTKGELIIKVPENWTLPGDLTVKAFGDTGICGWSSGE